MVRKKKPEPDDNDQSARFIEAAERIEEEDSWERFEEAVKKIFLPPEGNVSAKTPETDD
jgi:hypothetical protein